MINESLLPSNKKAFTLAEVLITLSILGVVAALTIPNLVNRQSDIAAQTKLKKAISNYHDVVEVFLIENETASAATMMGDNCANAGNYFKIAERNNCIFKTADGARWEFDSATGNAVVADSGNIADANVTPRYAVVLWNANGFVNSDQCNDNNQCGTTVAPPAYTGHAPTNGYFNAKEFVVNTGAQLKTKAANNARNAIANAYAQAQNPDVNANTGLANAIAAE